MANPREGERVVPPRAAVARASWLVFLGVVFNPGEPINQQSMDFFTLSFFFIGEKNKLFFLKEIIVGDVDIEQVFDLC